MTVSSYRQSVNLLSTKCCETNEMWSAAVAENLLAGMKWTRQEAGIKTWVFHLDSQWKRESIQGGGSSIKIWVWRMDLKVENWLYRAGRWSVSHFKVLFYMGQPRPLFVYFPFSHQVESNSDSMDPSWPLYPLDHHQGLTLVSTFEFHERLP